MESTVRIGGRVFLGVLALVFLLVQPSGFSQDIPLFTEVKRSANDEVALKIAATLGQHFRLEMSSKLPDWTSLATIKSAGTNSYLDAGAVYSEARFYRAVAVEGTNVFTGDHFPTMSGDVVVQPVNHASFVMRWNDVWIYNDAVGGAAPYRTFPRASLILVSHTHGDHFDSSSINALKQEGTWIIAPAAVYASLSAALKSQTIPLANGQATNVFGITVDAVPAYNANHPKGVGNAYVVTMGGKRFFMSGDTGNTAEMRALKDVDVAFVCMNLPFTMSVADAVNAVRGFVPRVVYPYHYRNSDGTQANLSLFKQQVGTDRGVEVRMRKWY